MPWVQSAIRVQLSVGGGGEEGYRQSWPLSLHESTAASSGQRAETCRRKESTRWVVVNTQGSAEIPKPPSQPQVRDVGLTMVVLALL